MKMSNVLDELTEAFWRPLLRQSCGLPLTNKSSFYFVCPPLLQRNVCGFATSNTLTAHFSTQRYQYSLAFRRVGGCRWHTLTVKKYSRCSVLLGYGATAEHANLPSLSKHPEGTHLGQKMCCVHCCECQFAGQRWGFHPSMSMFVCVPPNSPAQSNTWALISQGCLETISLSRKHSLVFFCLSAEEDFLCPASVFAVGWCWRDWNDLCGCLT